MTKLFKEVTSLYRLDSISAVEGKADLGPLPGTARALIGTLIAVWILIGLYVFKEFVKKSKKTG
jgi:multiple sugar transport system substrate-binding protein